MREEQDTRQFYIPWTIFHELHDEKTYRYGNVAAWSRMRSRVIRKFFRNIEAPEPTRAGLYRAVDQSRFGDVLAYLVNKNILADPIPRLSSWLHSVPHTHYVLFKAREEFQDSERAPFYGAGASYSSFTEALSKAIGEFLERYALLTSFFHKKNIITRHALGDTRIPRALFFDTPRFFSWQKPYCPKGLTGEILNRDGIHDAAFSCVKGESVQTGKKIYIPLQYIQWGPEPKEKPVPDDSYRISPQTTSGAGGGFTLAEATLSGLCELIERDGFLIYWLNRLSPRRVSLDETDTAHKFSPRFWEVYRSLSDRGYKLYFLDTTTDLGIPSVACCITAPLPGGRNAITVSGKCHADPREALERALLEHTAFLSSPPRESAISINSGYKPFANAKIGKKERISLWRSGEMTDEILFFIAGKEITIRQWLQEFPPVPASPDDMLAHVLSTLAKKEKESGPAYEVFRYETCDPILKELEYKVVKVVVPALMPLYLKETYARLDSVRLREVPEKLGYRAASPAAYNPFPHPFG